MTAKEVRRRPRLAAFDIDTSKPYYTGRSAFNPAQVMPALSYVESHGNGTAVSPAGALGSTQLMPATAQEMAAKLGLPYQSNLLNSNDPNALQYQNTLGQAYLQQGYNATGNLRDALRYYHGGPNRAEWGPKTNAYADAVLHRMGGM